MSAVAVPRYPEERHRQLVVREQLDLRYGVGRDQPDRNLVSEDVQRAHWVASSNQHVPCRDTREAAGQLGVTRYGFSFCARTARQVHIQGEPP